MKKFKKKYVIAVVTIALVIILPLLFCLVGMIKEKVMVFYGMENKL